MTPCVRPGQQRRHGGVDIRAIARTLIGKQRRAVSPVVGTDGKRRAAVPNLVELVSECGRAPWTPEYDLDQRSRTGEEGRGCAR